jgi:olfactory receptor
MSLHPLVGGVLGWRFCTLYYANYLLCSLPFGGPNIIDHFICDMYPLLELSCTDTYFIGLAVVANGGAFCMVFFILVLISYGIILNFLKTHSLEERHKTLSICSSYLTVVGLFFVPCIFMYVRPVFYFPIDKSIRVVLQLLLLCLIL